MPESGITIGSILASLFSSIIMMALLAPIMLFGGVYNPSSNSTTPAGNYIKTIYGINGVYNYTNQSLNGANGIASIPFAQAANQSTGAITPQSLAQTSGFAFVAGGLGKLWNGLWHFPGLLYTILVESLSYPGLQKLLPFDIAGLLSVGLLGYTGVIMSLKVMSIISKPGQSIENV